MAKDKAYSRRHHWVRGIRGPAKDQQCENCGARAYEWSTIAGRTGTDDPADYWALCRSCHRLYDGSARGELNGGARLTEQQVLAIYARRTEGPTALGREFGVCKGTINHITSGGKWGWLTGAQRPDGPYRGRKLTPDQVRGIRRRPGETTAALAREFSVSKRVISLLRKGETYRDVA
jgi:hypothetical protein